MQQAAHISNETAPARHHEFANRALWKRHLYWVGAAAVCVSFLAANE